MNLHWIDWSIVIILLTMLIGITVFTRKYTKGVADFLAANRLAGRYLLTVSSGFGGAISIVAAWEMVYDSGLPTQWWNMMSIPLGLFISLTGFVIYRFRQTRSLTLAQFLEVRYSRRFRFFAGGLCWLSGILNYGIFPAVTSRFIIYFFGLPEHFTCMGMTISMFPIVMLAYLGMAVFIAWNGGQISIMLTDFAQGIMMMIIFLVVMFFLLAKFQWSDLVAGLQCVPAGKSLLNPFKGNQAGDFSVWYFLIGLFGTIYTTRAWQGNSGYNAAARTPHEAVMAGIIGSWREFAKNLCMLLIPLAAYAVMHLPAFAAMAAPVKEQLAQISDPIIRNQMTTPLFLTHLLPVGMMGLFAAVIVACAISCDDTYIHAWGTIFIQDVVMPLRRKPLEPHIHMRLLRMSIVGVAMFGFVFSMLFPLKDFILMYFALTGAIYVGGAGAVIIGGLYWKRGTAEAAWTALISGTVLGFGGMLLQQIWQPLLTPLLTLFWPKWHWLAEHQDKFPLNGQIIYFIAMLTALLSYILVSLLGPRRIFDMDKMLHRGKYAIKEDEAEGDGKLGKPSLTLRSLIGITPEFSTMDRFIAYATFFWLMGWWTIFLLGTLLSLTTDWITDAVWSRFWWWNLVPFSVILGTICSIWILSGGIRDAMRLIRDLRRERVDTHDDGFVSNNNNQ